MILVVERDLTYMKFSLVCALGIYGFPILFLDFRLNLMK